MKVVPKEHADGLINAVSKKDISKEEIRVLA